MIARLALLWFAFIVSGSAQKSLPEEVLLLSRIKLRMQEHLRSVPNFTCLETVERFERRPGFARLELIDVIRLEVAYVGGNELFAWPGSQRFEEMDIASLIATGAFSNGNFVLHPKAVFGGDGVLFTYAGPQEWQSQAAVLFHFDVPMFSSGYEIRNASNGQRATVPYKGKFWARKADSEVLRLYLEGYEFPDALEVKHASHQLDFQIIPIGSTLALLPKETVVRLEDTHGVLSENRIRLSRCRQFQGESTLKFEELTEESASAAKAKSRVVLPAGLSLPLALDAAITPETSAVGDAITASVAEDVRQGKQILVPKGAQARGRIVRLQRDLNGTPAFIVGLHFDELTAPEFTAPLQLRLERTSAPTSPPRSAYRMQGGQLVVEIPQPGPNCFLIFGNSLRLSPGFLTVWQTQTVVP